MYKRVFKRCIDIFISSLALVLLSPLLVAITIVLALHFRGTPFFMQERPGRHGKIFRLYKFKSMADTTDGQGNLLPDSARITFLGRILRKTSLDELAQLINVIKGDMSLIGPRPLLIRYMPYYTPAENIRHAVRPGLTGWAQVNGRNNSTWNNRLEADIYYVKNLSFKMDMKILFKTAINVFLAKDIIHDQSSHMLDFDAFRKLEYEQHFDKVNP